MQNDLAKEIARLRNKQRRLIVHIGIQADKLLEVDNELCVLLAQAAQLACDAGQIDGDVTATVIEPKNN